ncbi:KRR1 small subunit processome component [Tanacetum coccineum]
MSAENQVIQEPSRIVVYVLAFKLRDRNWKLRFEHSEKYLQEVWPIVKNALKQHGIKGHLDLVKGSMIASTTKKMYDPYIIMKSRDLVKKCSCTSGIGDFDRLLYFPSGRDFMAVVAAVAWAAPPLPPLLLPGYCRKRFLALGWHLEEIHVTWAHLEKKQTRLRTYTKSLEDLCKQWPETASQA